MSKSLYEIEKFSRSLLQGLYDQCTEAQQNFFNRLYVSVEEIPQSKIIVAIQQCETTIAKNKMKENIATREP